MWDVELPQSGNDIRSGRKLLVTSSIIRRDEIPPQQKQHFQNQSVTVAASERASVFVSTHHDSQSSVMAAVHYKPDCGTHRPISPSALLLNGTQGSGVRKRTR